MTTILRTKFGSHVYGTNLPTSDTDIKVVFFPSVRDIILQKAQGTIVTATKDNKSQRNTSEDTDVEMFALHRYLELLMQGQTVALDMLFTPKEFYLDNTGKCYTWLMIQKHKDKLLHRGTTAFIGYARQQAAKYGVKGSRISAIRAVLDYLKQCYPYHKLNVYFSSDQPLPQELQNEYTKITMCKAPNNTMEPHLEVCNRKIPFHATIKYATEIFQKIFDQYGARALLAEKNEGIDWKALMHAVRVNHQAIELYNTHNITFPRPEKELLLKIRKGELPYKEISSIIEQGLVDLEEAAKTSTLPEHPDKEWVENFIFDEYYNYVR